MAFDQMGVTDDRLIDHFEVLLIIHQDLLACRRIRDDRSAQGRLHEISLTPQLADHVALDSRHLPGREHPHRRRRPPVRGIRTISAGANGKSSPDGVPGGNLSPHMPRPGRAEIDD